MYFELGQEIFKVSIASASINHIQIQSSVMTLVYDVNHLQLKSSSSVMTLLVKCQSPSVITINVSSIVLYQSTINPQVELNCT